MQRDAEPEGETDTEQPKLDRSAFAVSSLAEADAADKAYWLSRTPEERLRHMEVLRRIKYGSLAGAGIQRVIKIVKLSDT